MTIEELNEKIEQVADRITATNDNVELYKRNVKSEVFNYISDNHILEQLNTLNLEIDDILELLKNVTFKYDSAPKAQIVIYTKTNKDILTGKIIIPEVPTNVNIIDGNIDDSKLGEWSQQENSEKLHGDYLWTCMGTYSLIVNPTKVEFSSPMRLTPEDGTDGEDGKYREYIYKVTETEIHPELPPSSPYSEDDPRFQLSDNWIKDAVDAIPTINNRFTWTAYREKNPDTEKWSNYKGPSLWSVFSKNGKDGDGVEWIFHLVSNSEFEKYKLNKEEFKKIDWVIAVNSFYNKDLNSKWQTSPEIVNEILNGWSDDSNDPNIDYPYVFATYRKRIPNEEGVGIWGKFITPFFWGKWSEDGIDSPDQEYIYIGLTENEYYKWNIGEDNSFANKLKNGLNEIYNNLQDEQKQIDEIATLLNNKLTIDEHIIEVFDDNPGVRYYYAIAKGIRKAIDKRSDKTSNEKWPTENPFESFWIESSKGEKGDQSDSVLFINIPNNVFRTYNVDPQSFDNPSPNEGPELEIQAYGIKADQTYGISKPQFNGNLKIEEGSLIYVSSDYKTSSGYESIDDSLTLSTYDIITEDKRPLNIILSTGDYSKNQDWLKYNNGNISEIVLNFYKAIETINSSDYTLNDFFNHHGDKLIHMPYLLQLMKFNQNQASGEIMSPPGILCTNDSINISVDNQYYLYEKEYSFDIAFYVGDKKINNISITDISISFDSSFDSSKQEIIRYTGNKEGWYKVKFTPTSGKRFNTPTNIIISTVYGNYSFIKEIQLKPSIDDVYEISPNIQYITCTGGTGQNDTRTNWQPIIEMTTGNYIFFPCYILKNGIRLLNTDSELYNLYWRVYFKDTNNKTWYLNGNKLSETDCKYKLTRPNAPAIYIPTTGLNMNTGVTIEIYRSIGTNYTLLDSEKVDLIVQGSMGIPGSTIRMRGEYKNTEYYFNNVIPIKYIPNKDPCPYQVIDVIIHNNEYYRLNDNIVYIDPQDYFDPEYWTKFTQYDNIATGVIIAENSYAKIAQNGTLIVGDDIPVPEEQTPEYSKTANNIVITLSSDSTPMIESRSVVEKPNKFVYQRNWSLSGKDGLHINANQLTFNGAPIGSFAGLFDGKKIRADLIETKDLSYSGFIYKTPSSIEKYQATYYDLYQYESGEYKKYENDGLALNVLDCGSFIDLTTVPQSDNNRSFILPTNIPNISNVGYSGKHYYYYKENKPDLKNLALQYSDNKIIFKISYKDRRIFSFRGSSGYNNQNDNINSFYIPEQNIWIGCIGFDELSFLFMNFPQNNSNKEYNLIFTPKCKFVNNNRFEVTNHAIPSLSDELSPTIRQNIYNAYNSLDENEQNIVKNNYDFDEYGKFSEQSYLEIYNLTENPNYTSNTIFNKEIIQSKNHYKFLGENKDVINRNGYYALYYEVTILD